MSPIFRALLVALAAVALFVPSIAAGGVSEDPPDTTPVVTTPAPDPVEDPVVTTEDPEESVTLQVPPLVRLAPAAPVAKAKVAKVKVANPRAAPARRAVPVRGAYGAPRSPNPNVGSRSSRLRPSSRRHGRSRA